MLLAAAGGGVRFGGPKLLVDVGGEPMLVRSVRACLASDAVTGIVVAVPTGMVDEISSVLQSEQRDDRAVTVVEGGETRSESVRRAFEASPDHDAYAIHDVARCLCPSSLFDECFDALDHHEAVAVCVPVVDTLKRVQAGLITETVDRLELWSAQTPQAMRRDVLLRAIESGVEATDDAALAESMGLDVHVIMGSPKNFKITTQEDLAMAEALIRA